MLLHRFLPRTEFDSYEDFKANYKVNIPEDFNFGFDVVDAWAEADKNKKALVWCNDHGEEKHLLLVILAVFQIRLLTISEVLHQKGRCCYDDTSSSLGILDLCNRTS